ncbi:MAG: MFS transporter [Alphaproteobacteria bacterium]|nr:MFS transporter [Alphaproteobacteria bacterium]
MSACWALHGVSNLLLVSVAVLSGHLLADNKAFAALPVALQWTGTALFAAPASFYMRRFGRRVGFWTATMLISAGAALAVAALYEGRFALLCFGGVLMGAGNAFNWYYRFAAAEVVPEDYRSRAISFVLAGGVVAAFVGPSLADLTKDLLAPVNFAGAFAAMIVINALTATILLFVRVPQPHAEDLRGGRSIGEIARQPAFIVAVIGGAAAYGVMVLMMSVTPLAMMLHKHTFSDATFVIQWHVLGMYIPSFFTGHLIRRLGVLSIMLAGTILVAASIGVGFDGTSLTHFWVALATLGIGWNFLFIGATTLLTETYSLSERAKTQAFNEAVIFTTVGVATFFSGTLLHEVGWRAVNLAALPAIVLVASAIVWLMFRSVSKPSSAGAEPGE